MKQCFWPYSISVLTLSLSCQYTFNMDGGRSLREVAQPGLVLPAGNVLTVMNIGAASFNISDVALLFQT